jgi:hypothetical protein
MAAHRIKHERASVKVSHYHGAVMIDERAKASEE